MINGLDELIDLVNTQNDLPRVITQDNVVFKYPRVLMPFSVADQGPRNTAVTLQGIPYKGYDGQTDVYYKRGDLVSLFEGMNPNIRENDLTVDKLLAKVNHKYGLKLELRDLDTPDLSAFEGAPLETIHPVELRVIDNSYRWVGTVTITTTYGNPLLTSSVLVQLLPMLEHPDDIELLNGRLSGRMQTWGVDFTAWKDRLQIDPESGQWHNFADVQTVGQEAARLSYWYNSTVVDLPTDQVAGANPTFERVLVQSTPLGSVKGPLYFHYDVNW
jgi:hypothetical protein